MNKKILLLLPLLAVGLISQNVSADTGKFYISYYSDGHSKSNQVHRNYQRHDKHRNHSQRYDKHRSHHNQYAKHRKHHNKAHLKNYVRRHWQSNSRHQQGRHLSRQYKDWKPSSQYRHHYGYNRHYRHGR